MCFASATEAVAHASELRIERSNWLTAAASHSLSPCPSPSTSRSISLCPFHSCRHCSSNTAGMHPDWLKLLSCYLFIGQACFILFCIFCRLVDFWFSEGVQVNGNVFSIQLSWLFRDARDFYNFRNTFEIDTSKYGAI